LTNRKAFFRPPLAVIANPEAWLNEALESILEPMGYRVLVASSGKELLERAVGARPDLVLLNAVLKDLDSIQLCRTLRQSPAIARAMPILLVTSTPTTKQQRLAALQAGAWEYLSLPVEAEELVLKLDTYTRVKLEVDRAVEESTVDPASGLYSSRGLERRSRELVSDAFRRHAALACVALGVELEPGEAQPGANAAALAASLEYVAQLLQARGRTSDAIGRLSRSEFAVLAPATDATGAVLLAERLAQTIESARPRPAGLPSLRVRAGYEAVSDLSATPIQPQSLLEHASAALQQAQAGNGERIRSYQPGSV
jgi:diguanylate cyclase (GGDEF)-like protein